MHSQIGNTFQPTPLQCYVRSELHRYTPTELRVYTPGRTERSPSKGALKPSASLLFKIPSSQPSGQPAQTTRFGPDSLFGSTRIATGLDYGTARSPVADALCKISVCRRCCRCGNTPETSMPSRTLQRAIDSIGGHAATPTPRPLEGRKHEQNRHPDRRALPRWGGVQEAGRHSRNSSRRSYYEKGSNT